MTERQGDYTTAKYFFFHEFPNSSLDLS